MTPPTTVHPATLKRAKIEAELYTVIEDLVERKVMYRQGSLTKEALMRAEEIVQSTVTRYRDACYAELDDNHGLGKRGLDTAREVVEDALWFPLQRLSAGGRQDDAWLVSDDAMRALAQAIGAEEEL